MRNSRPCHFDRDGINGSQIKMYKCWNCEAIFEEPVYKKFTYEDDAWGHIADISYTEAYCPKCGDEEFEE